MEQGNVYSREKTEKGAMTTGLRDAELWLCSALKASINGSEFSKADETVEREVLKNDKGRGVLALLYPFFDDISDPGLKKAVEYSAKNNAVSCYRLFQNTRYILEKLEAEGIDCAVLKGVDLASRYPVPEYRGFADIDLFIRDREQIDNAVRIIENCGFEKEKEQSSIHHIAFLNQERIEIELHTDMVRPFDSEAVNSRIADIYKSTDYSFFERELFGARFKVLPDSLNGFYLLLHTLQHFLAAGFGLRLLLDWTAFWNGVEDDDAYTEFMAHCDSCKVRGFSDAITGICVKYLGMSPERAEKIMSPGYLQALDKNEVIDKLAREVFDAGRFGEGTGRLVNLRNPSIFGLIKEFHHQTRINYPKASRIFLIWPILWIGSLIRFTKNNKTVRHTGAKEIIGNAKKRSRLTKEIGLW